MHKYLIIISGILLILAGSLALYYGYEQSNFTVSASAWAGIIIGTLMTLLGLSKRTKSKSIGSAFNKSETKLLIQAMGSTVMADGKISPEEIYTIVQILFKMTGEEIKRDGVHPYLDWC